MRRAGDKDGPFAGDGPLRVLIDLPSHMRQVEAGPWEGPAVPVLEHILWSLCQGSPDIELHWLAQPGESGVGAVHFKEPDLSSDHWPFTFSTGDGGTWLGALSMYRQLERMADQDPTRNLDTFAKAALSEDLRAHITVTDDAGLLSLTDPHTRHINAMTATEALAVVGLYLRKDDPYLGAWAPNVGFNFGAHLAAWVAVRSQLPSGWRWGSALVKHSAATKDDYAMLLFGSFFERLVRMLNHRDKIHRATFQRADNQTGLDATEALDTFMFNVVGAFDAAAIAAHLGAGRPFEDRKKAGWQSKDWRKELGVPHLYEMFHKNKPADDLFAVCRVLRNTVHGAGLSSMVASSASRRATLVQLPRVESAEIVDRLSHLAPPNSWGVDERHRGHLYVDASRLVEGLIPHIFATLEAVLAHTPLGHFAGAGDLRAGVPTDATFDLSTRTRTSLLYGLTPPSH
jgi:hypothetical protein